MGADIVLAQTLHGYDRGHRLLASSDELSEDELSLLDRLSDLSGYLPTGVEFDRYHTGFPCGRYYAIACTWPDSRASRQGAVLTHTLLLRVELLASLDDPFTFTSFHRRPVSASERDPYRRPLHLPAAPVGLEPPSPRREVRLRQAFLLYFHQQQSPILWVEDRRPDDVVRALLSWLAPLPAARRRFSFCTLALQPRTIDGHPFEFLALPRAAQGSFPNLHRSPGWSDETGVQPKEMNAVQPWVEEMLDEGVGALYATAAFCARNGLPSPRRQDVALCYRFEVMAGAARERLTAARARADLLARIAPSLGVEHPLWQQVFQDLLDRLENEFSVREVADLLSRPQVQRGVQQARWLARRVLHILEQTIDTLRATAEPSAVADLALAGATIFSNPAMCYLAWELRQEPSRGLKESIAMALRGHQPAEEVIAQLLARAPAAAVLDWALSDDIETLAQPLLQDALKRALRAAQDHNLSLKDLALRSQGAPLGPVLFAAYARSRFDREAVAVLREVPALSLRLVFALFQEEQRRQVDFIADAIIESLPVEDVLASRLFREALTGASLGWRERRLLERIFPSLLRSLAWADGELEVAVEWLKLSLVQTWLPQVSPGVPFGYDADFAGAVLSRLAAAICAAASSNVPAKTSWISHLLYFPVEKVRAQQLEQSISALIPLLDLPIEEAEKKLIAARLLEAVRRCLPLSGHRLVEQVFPLLYPDMASDRRGLFWWALDLVMADGWDKAKPWRHWLLDTYISQGWPRQSFLRALGGDIRLFDRLCHRARRKLGWKGHDFIEGLPDALAEDPALAAIWERPMQDLIIDPDRPVDYD